MCSSWPTPLAAGAVAVAVALAESMFDEKKYDDAADDVADEFWGYWSDGVLEPSETELTFLPDGEEDRSSVSASRSRRSNNTGSCWNGSSPNCSSTSSCPKSSSARSRS